MRKAHAYSTQNNKINLHLVRLEHRYQTPERCDFSTLDLPTMWVRQIDS